MDRGNDGVAEPVSSTLLRKRTMSSLVADALRERILNGVLKEGDQLRQEHLAAEFGLSKIPVREALQQLEAEGFITTEFHKGAVVAGLSADEVMEIFELRAVLEGWLIELAMKNATPADAKLATKHNTEIRKSVDRAVFPTLNWKVHEALYLPARKTIALDNARRLYMQTERYVRMQFSIAVNVKDVVAEHAEIISMYEAKDKRCSETLRSHILDAAHRLTEVLKSSSRKT
jgi:DNA-binding GntR family transcriptional regulator